MKNLLVFLAFSILAVTMVTSQDKSKVAGPTCMEAPLTLPDDKRVIINDCYAQFGEKYNNGSGQEPKNITCIWACYLKKTGLISEENKFVKDKLAENLKTYGLPTDTIEPLAKELALCIDTKASTFEIKDGSCDSIQGIFACAGVAYNKVCNPKKS